MSDDNGLTLWKQKRLIEMQKKILEKKTEQEAPPEQPKKTPTPEEKLNALFVGRAKEVYEIAGRQYPEATQKVTEALARLVDRGELSGPVSGEELFAFFKMLGIRVRLQTKISYVEDGKVKSIAEKMRHA